MTFRSCLIGGQCLCQFLVLGNLTDMCRSVFAILAVSMTSLHSYGEDIRFVSESVQMAVPFRITLYAKDEATGKQAVDAALARVEELNAMLSDYAPESEINKLSLSSGSGKPVKVSPDLWNVLERSQHIAEITGGAFDVTVGPLVNVWRRARRQQKMPDLEMIERMKARSGYQHMKLDAVGHTVELTVPEMHLDVGGMAKGYVVDQTLKVLKAHGITRAVVAASGDIGASDAPPDAPGWRIMISPLDVEGAPAPRYVMLKNSAVSTSGDSHQRVEINGVRYSHIVDPHTGIGITDHSLVTVLAPDCTTTDLLETTLTVLGPEAGMKLIEGMDQVACYIIRKPGDKIEQRESSRWKELAREEK